MSEVIDATVVIVAWNEEDGIRAILPRMKARDYAEVFAIDGGSTDATAKLLEEAGIPVHRQVRPGRGGAILDGIGRATREIVVVFSPDGNEDPADIPRLVELARGGADLAIASRFLPASRNEEDDSVLPARAWANRAFTMAANILWNRGPRVTDTINGFRALRKSSFDRLGVESLGFTIEYETTIRAMKSGMRIAEIPTREGDRIGGATKAPSIGTGMKFLGFLAGEILAGRRRSAAG